VRGAVQFCALALAAAANNAPIESLLKVAMPRILLR